VARQLVSIVYGGGRGVLTDRGGGGVVASGESSVAGVAGGGGVDQLPCSGSALDPSGHAVLRPALSFIGVRYPLLSGPAASNPSPKVAFMPLRSEIPADAAPAPTPAPKPVGRLTVRSFDFLFDLVELLRCPGWGNGAFVK
jgi:hypothetical protein